VSDPTLTVGLSSMRDEFSAVQESFGFHSPWYITEHSSFTYSSSVIFSCDVKFVTITGPTTENDMTESAYASVESMYSI